MRGSERERLACREALSLPLLHRIDRRFFSKAIDEEARWEASGRATRKIPLSRRQTPAWRMGYSACSSSHMANAARANPAGRLGRLRVAVPCLAYSAGPVCHSSGTSFPCCPAGLSRQPGELFFIFGRDEEGKLIYGRPIMRRQLDLAMLPQWRHESKHHTIFWENGVRCHPRSISAGDQANQSCCRDVSRIWCFGRL